MSARLPEGVAAAGRFGLAYTSYVVRMLQGRDIFKTTAAALPAERFIELCAAAGVAGCQIDLSQLAETDAAALARVRRLAERYGMFLELSVPGATFESSDAFEPVARVARALGVSRLRVGLLWGRRYESFDSMEKWRAFVDHWQNALPRVKPLIEKHQLYVGIENHKDWLAGELAAWLTALDSPFIGACLDFGNNLALLEDPMATVEALAPFAVTTHVKDMAVQADANGFRMSEVPLGSGLLPLGAMVETLRRARPDVHFCLEMITRDPLDVPYKQDRYWTTRGPRDEKATARFVSEVLGKAGNLPLPTVQRLSPDAALAAEDENVRLCVTHARDVLKL